MGKRTALVEETVASVVDGAFARHETQPVLDALLRAGATRLLQAALELEVEQYLERLQTQRDGSGRRLVVRNGHHQGRTVLSSSGPVPVRQPRVHDRRPGERFTSAILPPYLRRTPSLEALIPTLYLKGVSTSEFPEALEAILGPGVGGLSSANIVRLKRVWEDEFAVWSRRRLEGKRYVYWWADAIYFQVRLRADRPCVLVLVGATEDGRKELLAVHDGERESELSWRGVLEDLKARGLSAGPALATGDRALGFWKALAQVYPAVRTQVHKTANLLDKLPKKVQPDAKRLIHEMYMSPIQGQATVLVNSPQVTEPVVVHYAWASNPAGANLINAEGLPASPFRFGQMPR